MLLATLKGILGTQKVAVQLIMTSMVPREEQWCRQSLGQNWEKLMRSD